MRRMRTATISLGLTLCLAAAAACSNSSGSKSASNSKPYKIGLLVSESGDNAALGPDEIRGATIAVDEQNAKGGVDGHKLELDVADVKSQADIAVTQARKLISDGVVAIVGPDGTPTMLATVPIVKAAKVPTLFITPSQYPNYNKEPYLFNAPQPTINENVLNVFRWLQAQGISKLGMVLGNDALGDLFHSAAAKAMAQVTNVKAIEKRVPTDSSDYTSVLASLRSSGAQALFSGMTGPASATVRVNEKQIGWDVPYFTHNGNTGASFLKLLGSALDGTRWYVLRTSFDPSQLPAGPAKDLITAVFAAYKAKYGTNPSNATSLGYAYDSTVSVIKALEAAKSGDRAAVRKALEDQSFVAMNGDVKRSATDHDGVGVDGSYLAEWKDGKFTLLKSPGA